MGAFESSEDYELSPPPPSHSTLFVVRNGRYEPQNLMPVLPRPDMLDFDGFVVRRGQGQGRLNPNPPEMRQEKLVKNPISIRRDSVRIGPVPAIMADATKQEDAAAIVELKGKTAVDSVEANTKGATDTSAATMVKSDTVDTADIAADKEDSLPVISFIFDALASGTLTLHLLVTEVETPLKVVNPDEEAPAEGSADSKLELKPKDKVKGPSYIKFDAQVIPANDGQENAEDVAFLLTDFSAGPTPGIVLDTFHIEKGLGQTYQSPLLDLSSFPAERLAYDPSRPKDIPIAARLEADVEPGEEQSVQYTYLSLTSSANSPRRNEETTSSLPAQWSVQLYSQKLQYGTQCFVLREVFGVTSKIAHDTEVEGGNSDCVICLSEPRDTAVLPCRHMCFCSYCAGIVRLQCDRCPVCRQKVQSLLQFKRDPDGTSTADLAELNGLPKSSGTAIDETACSPCTPMALGPQSGLPSGSGGYAPAAASSSAPMRAAAC